MEHTKAHILVVDDDTRLRSLLQRFLRENGFYVSTACDASSARERLKDYKFDLLIVDIMMPGETGLEFLSGLLKLVEKNAPGAERFSRYRRRLMDGDDVVFRGAPHMVLACTPRNAPCADIDPIIALSYFELYAQTLGVGTLWCGLFKWAIQLMPEFLERFRLPADYVPGYAMMFGRTGLDYRRSTQPAPVPCFSLER